MTNFAFEISPLEFPLVLRFNLDRTVWDLGDKFVPKGILGRGFTKAIVKFESVPLNTTLYQVSFKTKRFKVLRPNLPKTKHFRERTYENKVKSGINTLWIHLCTEFHIKQITSKFRVQICPKKAILGTELKKAIV